MRGEREVAACVRNGGSTRRAGDVIECEPSNRDILASGGNAMTHWVRFEAEGARFDILDGEMIAEYEGDMFAMSWSTGRRFAQHPRPAAPHADGDQFHGRCINNQFPACITFRATLTPASARAPASRRPCGRG